MLVKFVSMKGSDRVARNPFYVALVQHERTLSKREFYDLAAEYTGYKPTAVKAVFMAAAAFIRDNQAKGNITHLDGIASIRNYVRGSFDGLAGPWVKGRNYLAVKAVAVDPFKTLLAAIVPVNNTEGSRPRWSMTSSRARTCSPSPVPSLRSTRRRTTSMWRS